MAKLSDTIENLVARYGPRVQTEPADGWQPIETVRGFGYRYVPPAA